MTIILNENEWAREMIESKSIGKRAFETLTRVARYYLDAGYSKTETRGLLETFLLQSVPEASAVLWMDTLDRAVTYAAKRPAINIDYITITKPEMEIIGGLTSVQTRRLAFTLLCLAKYANAVNPEMNGWVFTDDKEIMKLANVRTSIRRQSAMYRQLKDAGMLQFSKKVDNTNVRVLYILDGEEAMRVSDFRSLGNQYLAASGADGYYVCENCGVIAHDAASGRRSDKRGAPKKYCSECADIIWKQWRLRRA